MPFDDLRQWIATLDRAGELKRIQTEADPILEIAEITDRVSKSKTGKPGGSALLFQNIKGHPGSQPVSYTHLDVYKRQALLKMLADPSPMVRGNAALSLVRFGDASGRPQILALLQSADCLLYTSRCV